MLYLGFSLSAAKMHLHGIVAWLDGRVHATPQQWLVLPRGEAQRRGDDLAPLSTTDLALQLAPCARRARSDPTRPSE